MYLLSARGEGNGRERDFSRQIERDSVHGKEGAGEAASRHGLWQLGQETDSAGDMVEGHGW